MTTNSLNSITEETQGTKASPATPFGACTSPDLGELLPDYVASLLEDSINEEFEEHLLDCLHCREKHLQVIGIGDALRKMKAAGAYTDEIAPQDKQSKGMANVLEMDRFKKGKRKGTPEGAT